MIKKLYIASVILLLNSCATLDYPANLRHIKAYDMAELVAISIDKVKEGYIIISDPIVCSSNKWRLPSDKNAEKARKDLNADIVITTIIDDCNGEVEMTDTEYNLGYQKGMHCSQAVFLKKGSK